MLINRRIRWGRYLLDWDVPEDEGRDKSGSWGMAENKLDTGSSITQLEARATVKKRHFCAIFR